MPLGDGEDASRLPHGHPRRPTHQAMTDNYDGTHSPWGPLVYVALVLGIVAMLLGAFLMTVERVVDHGNGAAVDVSGSPSSPREQMARLTITTATNTALVPPAYTTPSSGFCVTSSTTDQTFIVSETAASVVDGDGPYCADTAACPAGPVIPIAGRAWARLLAGGPIVISCRWVDDGNGYGAARSLGGGGAGPAACELTGGVDCAMAGQVRGIVGSAATPSITFGDLDTGIVGSPANQFSFQTNGVTRLSVASSVISATVPLQASGGTAGAPSYAGSGTNSDSGFYVDGSDIARISAAGFSRFSISAAAIVPTLPVQSTAGTSAVPAYSFASQPGDGMFSAGAGDLRFANGSSTAIPLALNTDDLGNPASIRGINGVTQIRGTFILPGAIGTTAVGTSTACTAAAGGTNFYVDDTNDTKSALWCVCGTNNLDVPSWKALNMGTLLWSDMGATCTP